MRIYLESRRRAHVLGQSGAARRRVGVSATYIFLFVLFGAFLKFSGFSDFINDLALTLVGRTSGGPAKVAVIASALMGMINGSALANVATTGAITNSSHEEDRLPPGVCRCG